MLDELISRATLEDLAGTTAFHRGEEYFSVGAVGRRRAAENKISARVEGTETYRVELRDDDGDLAYDCTCPRAADGYFCKHCVAVGLAWLAENSTVPKSGGASGKKKRCDPWRDIKEYLTTQPPETRGCPRRARLGSSPVPGHARRPALPLACRQSNEACRAYLCSDNIFVIMWP